MSEPHRSHQPHSTAAARTLRNGNRAHELTREERARGGYVKAAKQRGRQVDVEAADRIVWLLRQVGEDKAADAVQRTVLPSTVERSWEQEPSPLAEAQARILELERLVEELLAEDAIALAIENDLRR